MPSRTRRLSIRCSAEEHEVWTGAAFEEDISLEEFIRRAATERALTSAPATDSDGRSARTIRSLISHYEAMLAVIERAHKNKGAELMIAGLVGCVHCCHGAHYLHNLAQGIDFL